MIRRFFNSQTKTITFAAGLLAFSTLISRILGLLRDRLLAGQFGAGEELDIYFAAFRVPDFVYGIFIMGGISAVFLPVFSEYFRKDENSGWNLANNTLNIFFLFLILICVVLTIFAPLVVRLITPGFEEAQKETAVALTRIMFLGPIFFGLSSVFSGMLHYFNKFLVFSLAPILYNLGIIFGILCLYPLFGLNGLAFGVVLGALLHWVIQIPAAVASGYRYRPILSFKGEGIAKIFKLMIPRSIGATAYHLNLIVVTAIASTLSLGSISIFNFSNNLQYFPIGLIGASFATAVFPVLSRKWAEGLKGEFLEKFSLTFRHILFLIVPASVLLFLLRAQIVRLVLGTGEFGWLETKLTAACLGLFCIGVFASAFIPFLARVFYSFQNTKTPVAISLVAMGLNVFLSFFFVWAFSFSNFFKNATADVLDISGISDISVIGLPLALSLSAAIHFFILLVFLDKKVKGISWPEIRDSFKRIFLALCFMIPACYMTAQFFASFVSMDTFTGLLLQTLAATLAGGLAYFLVALSLRSPELKSLKEFIKR